MFDSPTIERYSPLLELKASPGAPEVGGAQLMTNFRTPYRNDSDRLYLST